MRNNRILKSCLICFLVALIVATSGFTYLRSAAKEVQDDTIFGEVETRLVDEMDVLVAKESPYAEVFEHSNRINFLLLGVKDGMTDTIMVISYDVDLQKINVISIPRDTYYYREGFTSAAYFKINSIYHTSGKNSKGENKDIVAIAKAVSDVLQGMPIHYYAIVTYQNVENIIDAIGGVEVDVPFDMDYEDMNDNPPLKIHIKKGLQTLNGEESMKYLRYRKGYTMGDLGRIEAQQAFIRAAFKKLISFDLPKIAKSVIKELEGQSDVTWGVVTKILSTITSFSSDSITTQTIPNTPSDRPPYFVEPNEIEIVEMLREIYGMNEPEESVSDENAVGEPIPTN